LDWGEALDLLKPFLKKGFKNPKNFAEKDFNWFKQKS
jgi:hypothetical protein